MAHEEKLEYKRKGQQINCTTYVAKTAPYHWHENYELEFVSSGSGDLFINGKRHDFTRGCVCFLRRKDYHERRIDTPGVVYKLEIPDECISKDLVQKLTANKANIITYFDEFSAEQVEKMFTFLISCKGDGDEIDYIKKASINIIYLLFRNAFKDSPADSVKSNQEKIADAKQFIKDNFREKLSVKMIADAVDMNDSYLNQVFKKETGLPIYNYLKQTRLEEACRLAMFTSMKSREIFEVTGYSSYSNFLRDFKELYGCSPMQMKK